MAYDDRLDCCEIEDDVPELARIAIQIILHAGDGKLAAERALELVHAGDLDGARGLLDEADGHITDAHACQTEIIQREAAGERFESCLVFNHAQDTLMTAMTEVRLTREVFDLYRLLDGRLGAVEARLGATGKNDNE